MVLCEKLLHSPFFDSLFLFALKYETLFKLSVVTTQEWLLPPLEEGSCPLIVIILADVLLLSSDDFTSPKVQLANNFASATEGHLEQSKTLHRKAV